MSTYIADNFDNVLLGYHCTLLKPNQKILNGKFLNAYLSSFYGRKYFSNCASGSGQRYTLTIDVINDLTIPLINIKTQQKIARTLSILDQKIENNHKINELLHTLAYKIYEYYFKYKPKNAKLEQIIIENPKSSIMVKNAQKTQDKYPFFTSGDNILFYSKAIIDGRNCFLNTGGNAGIKFYVGEASYSTDTWCICANEFSDYLYLLLSSIKTHINQSFFQGTSLKHLQKNLLKKYPIYMPSVHEIKKFNQIIMPLLTLISINTRTSKKLEQIRDFLLPLLLTQQVKPQ
ncbi:restriction endonuclease subunit S [Helicobacter pylori]|uniref:restriction endonuclease subunit S n=1 Tax=Helicobacter pylori TaxID=210 RepID=UPI003D1FBD0E